MATAVASWSSASAAANATADPAVNFAEGMAPSAVNDSARALMRSVAQWRDDIQGATIVTGGSSTAYTATAAQTGLSMIAFVPHATNGATVTLNVNSTGAFPLRSSPGTGGALPAGVLVQGTPYVATYFASNGGEWILQGYYGELNTVPIGGMIFYLGGTSPSTSLALPYGQAISRTTYSTLFGLTGTAHGVGDGSTTFNLPDIRGRTVFGQDNMGGTTASRITNAGSGVVGTTIGATGGAQTHSIVQANLPNVNFTVSGITAAITNGDVTIPVKSNGASSGAGASSAQGSVDGGTNSLAANSGTIGVNITAQGSAASGGSGTAFNTLPPAIILPFLVRII